MNPKFKYRIKWSRPLQRWIRDQIPFHVRQNNKISASQLFLIDAEVSALNFINGKNTR